LEGVNIIFAEDGIRVKAVSLSMIVMKLSSHVEGHGTGIFVEAGSFSCFSFFLNYPLVV
jgi:hypothetical protein